jgi:hypothetical protein
MKLILGYGRIEYIVVVSAAAVAVAVAVVVVVVVKQNETNGSRPVC